MSQSILLVGAGAVGQVYAHHFARAGHDVNFFLKEKHVAEARQGFTLYDLKRPPSPSSLVIAGPLNVVSEGLAAISVPPSAQTAC